jgi:hypothetical protein
MGIAALPAYICKSELRSRQLTRILPGWLAGESTFTAFEQSRPRVREKIGRRMP